MKNQKNNLHTFVILAYKESSFLEECIKSVLNQKNQSQVIVATTTPNQHISALANKYHLQVIKDKHTNIGGDFDFAVHSASTSLVTVAHQDDIYEPTYSSQIISSYHQYPNSSIIFSDYYELRNGKKVSTNTNLKVKRLLLTPIRIKHSLESKFAKRQILRFGCSICCPAVTFVTKNCPKNIFQSDFTCNVDWHAWETLSRQKGAFTYTSKLLMGHRISESSTTTDTINQGIRTKEDFTLFKRFWPIPIAKLLTKLYQKSERSNSLEDQ